MDVLKGKHCSFDECKQFDFLPFECEACHKTYCLQHRLQKDHKCTEQYNDKLNVIPKCPICNQFIDLNINDDINLQVNRHIDSQCKDFVLVENKKPACGYSKCKAMKAPIECKECHKFFCPQHRFPSDHECTAFDENASKSNNFNSKGKELLASFGIVKPNISKPTNLSNNYNNNNYNVDMSKERLRMKNVASGNKNVPVQDRFYVHVLFSKAINKKEITMFFNKNKTVGRILDEICDERRIKNENHMPNANKLVIECVRTKGTLPFDVSLDLLQPEFMSGDTILIKYENE